MTVEDAKSVFILGRQPALGIAELESLYGSDTVLPYGNHACLCDSDTNKLDLNRLGGSLRIARILDKLPSVKWSDIEKYLVETAPQHAEHIEGKLSFGLSVFGVPVSGQKVAKTALGIKKAIKASGKSVRMVPHKSLELGSATVLYNKLTSKNGWELLVISDGQTAYLAQTVQIQDIDAYSARDQARPYRDAKIGMLPPKLAQIILNLCLANTKTQVINNKQIQNQKPENRKRILDPFCGTGVVLQEAMLMDYDIYGSDIEPRMVQFSIDNLEWLDERYPDVGDYRRVEVGDATKHAWHEPEKICAVACETYLGQPLSTLPPGDQLSKIMHEVNQLHHRFLQNTGTQLQSGTRLCLAVPTWRGKHEFLHLSMLDYLDDLGYNRLSFKHVGKEDLIYHRENQVVGRELLVLEKK